MKILAIIPARGGSKGVPRKNIKLLKGKPLIQYTLDIAKQSCLFSEIIISTEDLEVAQIASKLGYPVPFMRPTEFAKDESPTIDVVHHCLVEYKKMNKHFDAVCILQPTNPLRSVLTIEKCVNEFSKKNVDTLISVREVPHRYNPYWTYIETECGEYLRAFKGDLEPVKRRQDLPRAFYRDGSVYLIKTEVIFSKNSLYGEKLSFVISESDEDVNIDTPNDWDMAEALLGTKYK